MASGLEHVRMVPELTDQRRQLLSRRIRIFVAVTISYNVLEAIIALTEGVRVSSTALIGFGLDSVIEVSSAAAVAWQERAWQRAQLEHGIQAIRPALGTVPSCLKVKCFCLS